MRDKTIAVLGVTFKPNTDDMRDAPSLVIVPMLQERGATVRAYDPQGRRHGEALLPGVVWCDSALEAAERRRRAGRRHRVERVPRPRPQARRKAKMRGDVLVDLRNVFSAALAHAADLRYSAVGRKPEAGAGAATPLARRA